MRSLIKSQLHHSWLSFSHEVSPEVNCATVHMRNVAHSLFYLQHGSACGRWVCRGKEFSSEGQSGFVRFNPADGEEHTLTGAIRSHGMRFAALIIPASHIQLMAEADGVHRLPEVRSIAWPNDTVLRRCLDVLVSPPSLDAEDEGDRDEASWTLVLRIAELMGAGTPDWHSDTSRFSRRALGDLVSYIDSHLRIAPCISDLALLYGLSPSHFARKFRNSTGMSVDRFVNQRRIVASLQTLSTQPQSLSQAALDLGFSSQSHFNRVFSGLTGMTPAKYRQQCRRMAK